jgi:hypothetical protein
MKISLFVLALISVSSSAFAECGYTLECANSSRSIVFSHTAGEGGDPYTDDSELTIAGKKTALKGLQLKEATDPQDANTAVPGDYSWSENDDSPAGEIFSLTPAGEVSPYISIVEDRSTRTKTVKKMSKGAIETDTYSFQGRLVLHPQNLDGKTKRAAVSCVSKTFCD